MDNMTGSVKVIEDEADRILASAREQANEILLKARDEATQITSAELSLDDVKAQCRDIVSKANQEAGQQIENARRQAETIKTGAAERVGAISNRIIKIISGAAPR